MKAVDSADPVLVGIDLGGTGSRFVAVSAGNQVLGRVRVRTPASLTTGQLQAFFRRHIAAATGGRPVTALGIGASGPVDAGGVIRNPDTLPAFTGVPVVADLAAELAVPVVIDNDAMVAAVAEYELGAAPRPAALLHVTLGTGIGAALLLDGRPFRGGDGRHPEGGHVTTASPTRRCYCGRERCWEQGASRTALQAAAAGYLGTGDGPAAIDSLAALAGGGDAGAVAVFDAFGVVLADGLSSLLQLYRPTAVVFGGSAAAHYDLFERALTRALAPLAWLPHCTTAASTLDDDAGAIGAALLAGRAQASRRPGSSHPDR